MISLVMSELKVNSLLFKLFYFSFIHLVLFASVIHAKDRLISYDNLPLGSKEEPFVFRTYVPDLGLDAEVMKHHYRGYESPRYSVKEAQDHPTQTYKLLMGLPAAIAVNEGKQFSYVWDTLECRLLYAWSDGFLDMQNYWGSQFLGSRRGFGYTSNLYGKLYYQAAGLHPLSLDGKSISNYKDLKFKGHRIEKQRPIFMFEADKNLIEVMVEEGEGQYSVELTYKIIKGKGQLEYKKDNRIKVKIDTPQSLMVSIQGDLIKEIPLKEDKSKNEISKKKGKRLYANMGCNACHTVDGTKSHGPSFKHLFGSKRELADGQIVDADLDYIRSSILYPNKQLVKGYPPNFMPAFSNVLKKPEVESLVMYIESIQAKKETSK